jgi:O-acetyl-ADP-ribose deacetylase (regulator of RNase III)
MSISIVNANLLAQPVGGIIADAATAKVSRGERKALQTQGLDSAAINEVKATRNAQVKQWEAEHKAAKLVATGDAFATSAGRIPVPYVIHAVGPVWGGGDFYEAELLFSAYERSFALALELGLESIAVPAIGMGIFMVPREVVATEFAKAAAQYNDKLDITICLINDEDADAFAEIVTAIV